MKVSTIFTLYPLNMVTDAGPKQTNIKNNIAGYSD